MNMRSGQEDMNIAHLSDFHIPFSNKRLSKIIDITIRSNPELILLTGDYIDTAGSIVKFENLVRRISKDRTVFYVLGNHDRRFKSLILKALSRLPNCFCVDKSAHIYTSKRKFKYIISSWDAKGKLMSTENLKHIVLIHNPKYLVANKLGGISLIFAGHIHGGQFVLKKLKNGNLFPGSLFYKYCFESRIINGTYIIISKGLGDVFPYRMNCPYEVVNMKIN